MHTLFCEIGNGHSAGTDVGTDDAAQMGLGNIPSVPQVGCPLCKALQCSGVVAGVAQQAGLGQINAAGLFDLADQRGIALLGATG